ncbi:MAG: hypothetical protein XE08_0267 [Parcubacteria bacterium 32_520]|nr:MAG: hypothetical protein XE08_0267 [Parcubacteria bacterium 32_520]
MEKYFCKKCGKGLKTNQEPYPFCGFKEVIVNDEGHGEDNVKIIHRVKIEAKVKGRESLKIRQKQRGFKKFMKEVIQGWFPNIITKDSEYGVDKLRIIDREKDEYHEVVKDLKNGDIIQDKHEPLSQHKHY